MGHFQDGRRLIIYLNLELARLVNEFEESLGVQEECSQDHHEQTNARQKLFHNNVKAFVATTEEMGNPFLDRSNDLVILDTKEVSSVNVVKTLQNAKEIGDTQFKKFMKDRLLEGKSSVFDPITKNKNSLIRTPAPKEVTKAKWNLDAYKSDFDLFSRLYIVVQVRGGDMQNFFQHENQPAPPTISDRGRLRPSPSKCDLVTGCLEGLVTVAFDKPETDCVVIDGAAVVHMLNTGESKTFQEYAQKVFVPYIEKILQSTQRVDVVWDRYIANSLKQSTRENRGTGRRQKVTPNGPLPKMSDFLKVSENKSELYQYLSKCIKDIPHVDGKQVYSTLEDSVITNGVAEDMESLAPCSHEEADTRMFVHALDAAQNGSQKILIKGSDTDLIVLAVSVFKRLNILELWVSYGKGSSLRYFPIHDLYNALGEDKATGILFFHAFTGCDTTSSIHGKGKVTAWDTWNVFPEITDDFKSLSSPVDTLDPQTITNLERFVIVMYDIGSTEASLTDARIDMFTRKGKDMFSIPFTSGACLQHVRRAVLQAGHIWGQALETLPEIPSASEWGWKLEIENDKHTWMPLWSVLPQASAACLELTKCGCKKGCLRNCKCHKVQLKCTPLCYCKGLCGSQTS